MENVNIRLTQYSHGAGCGCKIAPDILETVLKGKAPVLPDQALLVGNDHRDDAVAYDLGDGTALISTTDFFMPIVDDPYTFGKIAATNAISDVYAMGGRPLVAIAILGWPLDKLDAAIAAEVMEGGRAACADAGITIAGGHSIDSPEPIFGLAVTGRVAIDRLKKNDTATAGCRLYLTKPLGVGVLTTAQKRGILKPEHAEIAPEIMCRLNIIGMELAAIPGVKAITDVTGFGFLGHLGEMCEGSGLGATIQYDAVPKIDCIGEYIAQKSMPGATRTNWQNMEDRVDLADPEMRYVLCDPQTSGGLLVAVEEESCNEVEDMLKLHGLEARPVGMMEPRGKKMITVTA